MMNAERTESARNSRLLRFIGGTALMGFVLGAGSGIGFGASAASAAPITGHDASLADGITTVTLGSSDENAGDEASLLVLNIDGNLSDPSTEDIVWVGQLTLDDAGGGSASFELVSDDLCEFALAVNTTEGGDRYLAPLGGVEACGELDQGDNGGDDGEGDDGSADGGGNDDGGSDGGSGAGDDASNGGNNAGDGKSDGSDNGHAETVGSNDSGLATTAGAPGFWLTLLGVAAALVGGSTFMLRRKKN